MNWASVASNYGAKCTQIESSKENIDEALENYLTDSSKYAPPIIKFNQGYSGTSSHYIVIYGKATDGKYKCIDSSGYHKTYYQLVDEGYGSKRDGTDTYKANLVNVLQFQK